MSVSPLWQPSPERIARAQVTRFIDAVNAGSGAGLAGYADLWRFSVEQPGAFWSAVWDVCGVVGERGGCVVRDPDRMPGATFFPDARLNFAENLLRTPDDRPAIVFSGEDGAQRRLSRADLAGEVSRCAAGLRAAGVASGDRVAGYLPNLPEAITGMLATASLGAIWSSCSPDFGVQGVLDRFGQIAPRILLAADGYVYAGKAHDSLARVAAIAAALPSVLQTVVVPYLGSAPSLGDLPGGVWWPDFLEPHPASPLSFERFAFNHPLYILYSSGTTGVPKCILHGAGGTLIQHLKEHQLHCDIGSGDRVFYYTTCGWMMWNWLASALASEATILLYDGSPLHRNGRILFDLADDTGMTLFGTSAKFIASAEKAGLEPAATHRLSSLRTITSTGSPLAPESFDYTYRAIKRDVHLASISGGTDIVSCFVGGDPTGPVYRGEIQARGLGMRVDVFDEHGRPVRGQKGELVCTGPFPSMPLGFWNDPDGGKYHRAYFDRFPGVWCHGDYAEITPQGGVIIYGRSDAVLNPGGVRIGTAEVYRQVEQLDEVIESLVVGQQWESDERIVLFVRLREGVSLDEDLIQRIKAHIRQATTPRHVPARILQVTDIPRTRSGKIVELAVRDVIHGREVTNRDALANPEALDLFAHRPELAT
jgi:acetoacetyl-CoA synthetase